MNPSSCKAWGCSGWGGSLPAAAVGFFLQLEQRGEADGAGVAGGKAGAVPAGRSPSGCMDVAKLASETRVGLPWGGEDAVAPLQPRGLRNAWGGGCRAPLPGEEVARSS